MGFYTKEEKSKIILRALKTLFFVISMLISLLLFSAPVLLAISDTLLPSALLSASLSPSSLSLNTISSHFNNYDFRYSLIDIPLISIIRSAVIICVYGLCDGPRLSRGPYLGITTICSVLSLIFVSIKAPYVFSLASIDREGYVRAMEMALVICSLALAIGHIVVAYRTSCRERRKLLVFKIDIEALARMGFRGIIRRFSKKKELIDQPTMKKLYLISIYIDSFWLITYIKVEFQIHQKGDFEDQEKDDIHKYKLYKYMQEF